MHSTSELVQEVLDKVVAEKQEKFKDFGLLLGLDERSEEVLCLKIAGECGVEKFGKELQKKFGKPDEVAKLWKKFEKQVVVVENGKDLEKILKGVPIAYAWFEMADSLRSKWMVRDLKAGSKDFVAF